MFSLLILGKYSPEKEFHVSLHPLNEDMMDLWRGVKTYDVSKEDDFKLRVAFLWSIHEYPRYASMSSLSISGFYACVHCDENPCDESLIVFLDILVILGSSHMITCVGEANFSMEKLSRKRNQ
jgi:hypothetical protein